MFVRAPNPIWYLPDLVGQPLNDEYFAFFLTNTLPYLPQNVYRDNQGLTVWTNDVVQFYPNGTLPDNLYFDPNLVYRIEVRHGDSQTDPLIYEINDFVPGQLSSSITNPFPILFAENQVANPTFSNVNFSSTIASSEPILTITTAGTHDIAPGWQLVLVGTGSTTLKQKIFSGTGINSSPNAINFALEIDNNGWTTAWLVQRFSRNGAIFSGGAVSMSMLARAQGSAEQISVNYVPSDSGTPTQVIPVTSLSTGIYQVINGTVNLPLSDNNDLSDVAYVDMQVVLPTVGTVQLTDMQMVGQNDPIPGSIDITTIIPEYQQNSEERNTDHLFHYYADSLIRQPKDSLLAGWNFPLNPWQFRNPASANVATNSYTADQTIVIQQAYVASATGNNIAIGRGTNAQNFDLEVKAVTANNQFGLVQHIDPATIRPYWGKVLSSMVKARIVTTHSSRIAVKMRLFYRAGLPNTVSQTDPVATWTAGSDPVFAAGYTAIAPENDPVFIIEDSTEQTFSFDRFTLPASSNDNMTLGIMLYSITSMDETATADIIYVDDISLVHNDFAMATQPQTWEESLQSCQYYYEKSYDDGVIPGTASGSSVLNNVMFVATGGGNVNSKAWPFGFRFNTVKRIVPALHLYSIQGVVDQVTISNYTNGAERTTPGGVSITDAFWTLNAGTKGVSAIVVGTGDLANVPDGGTVTAPTAQIRYHYTADARLGV